jgi:hypothetical protein
MPQAETIGVDDLKNYKKVLSSGNSSAQLDTSDFDSRFGRVQKKFKDKYGIDFEITGTGDTPMHQKLHGGSARDVRSRNLNQEQINFLIDEATSEGIWGADYSKNPPKGSSGPHLHFQIRNQHTPPKQGITTISTSDLSSFKKVLSPNYMKGSKPGYVRVKYGEDENGKPIYREEESANPVEIQNLQRELSQGSHIKEKKSKNTTKEPSANQVKPVSEGERFLQSQFEKHKAEGDISFANRIGLQLQTDYGWNSALREMTITKSGPTLNLDL